MPSYLFYQDGWMNKQHSTIAKYRQQHLQQQSADKQATNNFGRRAGTCPFIITAEIKLSIHAER